LLSYKDTFNSIGNNATEEDPQEDVEYAQKHICNPNKDAKQVNAKRWIVKSKLDETEQAFCKLTHPQVNKPVLNWG